MVVEIISVGTELLLGNIVNTNAAFLSEKCAGLGLSCYYQSVVGDNEERFTESLSVALSRSDIILLSGGLGPTQDDMTKEVTAKVLGKSMYMDNHSKERIAAYFQERNIEITDNNWKQAMMPEGAIVVDNQNGTAPGVILQTDNKHVILLPGPPNELIPMFENDMMPYLNRLEPGIIFSQTIKICGMGESKAESMIEDLINQQTNPTVATYAKIGEVHLRVTAKAEDEKEAKRLVKPMVKEIKTRFGNHVYSTEEHTTLEKAVVDLLRANDLTITTAESCSGGLLSARLINVAGVSDVLKTGIVTYSNKAKRKFLGVKKSVLDKYGAVSETVAKDMAKGAANLNKADVAVAITGIAGPDGGSDQKPVGLVYIACFVCGIISVREYRFSGNRSKIRESAVSAALTLTRKSVLEYYSKVTFGKKK